MLLELEHLLKSIRSPAHRALIAALRDARKHAGLSQSELAGRLRRPQSFVSAYESGDRKIDVLEFVRIARAVKADPCDLLKRVVKVVCGTMGNTTAPRHWLEASRLQFELEFKQCNAFVGLPSIWRIIRGLVGFSLSEACKFSKVGPLSLCGIK